MARKKTIDDIRNELRKAKDANRKLRKQLDDARRKVWIEAAARAYAVIQDYNTRAFPPPDEHGGGTPNQFAAEGARTAASRLAREFNHEMDRS